MIYSKIAVFNYTKSGSEVFTYLIPPVLEEEIKVGQMVSVPFGKRTVQGLVLELSEEKPDFQTKEVLKITQKNTLPPHLIKTILFLKNHYVSSLKSCLNTVLPFNFTTKRRQIKQANGPLSDPSTFFDLNPEQKEAFAQIKDSLDNDLARSFLLIGITGSGKTEIYLHAIKEILDKGKSAIVLVPEISLTPQTFDTFNRRFPGEVALWHSQLKETERFHSWQGIISGEKSIIVGSRSAIFAPFENLGLIIIDEEQEGSFKQDQSPRYHARSVAREIQKETGATLILGSATPSLESYSLAQSGQITKLTLEKRATKSPLPDVEIVDLRDEFKKGNRSIFSEKLTAALEKNLTEGKQSILFINRRGASTFILCRDCGWVAKCPHCEIPFTYHLSSNSLVCHHCNVKDNIPTTCPSCKSAYIKYFGIGTQKVEYDLKKLFPKARIARMDRDSTTKRDSYENIYRSFKDHKVDILIGTQMIAKGWDIENVSLVGVISADNALFIPDFRAEEKTFQLLTQVAGRAGRREGDIGQVIIQTYNPDNFAINMVVKYEIETFYRSELKNRRKFSYPPFVNLVKILYNDEDQKTALELAENEKDTFFQKYRPLGPTPSFIPKINNKYRYLLLLKLSDDELEDFLNEDFTAAKGVFDIDPQSLLN